MVNYKKTIEEIKQESEEKQRKLMQAMEEKLVKERQAMEEKLVKEQQAAAAKIAREEQKANKPSAWDISIKTNEEIDKLFRNNNLEVNLSGGLIKVPTVSGDCDDYITRSISKINKNLRISGYQTDPTKIKEEWDDYVENKANDKEKKIFDYLSVHVSDELSELSKFLAIFKVKNKEDDPHNPPLELDVLVHAHSLQQIKKKFINRGKDDPKYPIATCWRGINGCGKSWALRFLCEKTSISLIPLFTSKVGDSVADIRNQYSIYSTYFLLLDDITELKKESAGLLRNIITDKNSNIRKMAKDKGTDIRNNSTIFLTSNISLAEIFDDPQEVRRYWQFNCVDKLPDNVQTEIFDKLVDIDFDKIWNNISLTKEYINASIFQEKIYPYQELWLLASQPVNEFIDNYDLFKKDESEQPQTYVTLSELVQFYKSFVLMTNRQTRMTTTRFKNSLARFGINPALGKDSTRPDKVAYLLNTNKLQEFRDLAKKFTGSVVGEI